MKDTYTKSTPKSDETNRSSLKIKCQIKIQNQFSALIGENLDVDKINDQMVSVIKDY